MTVTPEMVAAVRAADADLPTDLPLLAASRQIAERINEPENAVFAVLRGYYLTVQERAA